MIDSVNIEKGDFISSDDELSLAKVAVIGPDVSDTLFGEGTDPIGKSIQIKDVNFNVIGLTQSKGASVFSNPDENISIPLSSAMKILFGKNNVQVIFASAENSELVNQTMNDIEDILLEQHNISDPDEADFTVNSSKQALSILDSITSILTLMLASIAGISLVVGGVGIMNIMLVSVTERTREIGLLKSIGAKRKDILNQFLIEAIALTLTGGIIGIVLGIILAYYITGYLEIPYVLKYNSILIAVGVSTIVGIVFGLYPASRASKLNPIDALRFE